MDSSKRARLIQILGMMGSAHDGEILTAAKMAQRLLGSEATTWEEVLNGGSGYTEDIVRQVVTEAYDKGFQDGITKALRENPLQYQAAPRPTWQSVARNMLENYTSYLTEWEQGFLESFINRRWANPTPKQKIIFDRLGSKTGVSLP